MVDKSPVRTNVIGGVITAGVLGGLGWMSGLAPTAWKWFTDLLASVWAHLNTSATVATWWLYVLYAISAVAVLSVALRIRRSAKKTGPVFTDYTQDKFFGAVWRWQYAGNQPTGIWAFCPKCDTVLVYSYSDRRIDLRTTLHCETCRHDLCSEPGDKDELVGRIHRQIDRKIRTGEWKNYVEPKEPAQT